MAADRITIDISILQGIFGDLNKLQQQLSGVTGGVAAVDNAAGQAFGGMRQAVGGAATAVNGLDRSVDASMRNIVGDIMAPLAKTQELEGKLRTLGDQVRTSKSVKEIIGLKKEIAATQRELDGVNPSAMESKVSGAFGRMRSVIGSLAAPLVGAFAVSGLTAFAGDLAASAGAAQQFDSALTNMLQSKERADQLGAQVKTFAATTPFELPEVQKATTQMLAFGFGAEDTIPTLRKLGDVAAGLGQPVGDLAYLYGTTRVQGRLYSNDLMQFANRGIPIIEELSKVLNVSQSSVKEMVEKGKVNFGHLEGVFESLTAQGSKFGGLMDAQSRTITGQISNLSDAWGQFKTDLGLSMAPLITGIIGGLSGGIDYLRDTFAWVQANGDTIVSVLEGVGIAVGIYTIALAINNRHVILNTALQLIWRVQTAAMAIAMNVATAATTLWTGAQWLLNAALTANPIGIIVVAIAALVAGVIYAWNNFEGFRGVVMGVWEVLKGAFNYVADFIRPVIDGLIVQWQIFRIGLQAAWDLFTSGIATVGEWLSSAWGWVKGFVDKVVGVFSALADKMLAPFRKVFDTISSIPGVGKLLGKAKEIGGKVGEAFGRGQEKGIASFEVDKAKSKSATPGIDATAVAAPGQNVGAASLLGGKNGGTEGKGNGVTVGGDGKGSGRTITMDIKITNNITMPRDGNMGVRELADKLSGALVSKFNDLQYAAG